MRFHPDRRPESVPAPHVPWSADDDVGAPPGGAEVWTTPADLPLVYADFSRHFVDVRFQFVDFPSAQTTDRPSQIIVSGSTAPALAGRLHPPVPPR
jgi:hypothetical protein